MNTRWAAMGLTIVTIILLGLGYVFIHNQNRSNTTEPRQANISPMQESDSQTPPLLIKHLGVNLAPYDPKTNRAGDFVFTKQKLQFDRIFMGFGFVIPANSIGAQKANPQPTFILPLGTKVHSLVDGVVANMPKLYSGDYSIQVSTNGQIQKWLYETEHVTNPLVKVGERVKAGQIIAEVSNYDHGAPDGFGIVEIGILKGGNPPYHVCPFLYLDPSIKETVYANLRNFYKAWNAYLGKIVYDEKDYIVPGCLTTSEIQG